MVKPFRIMIVRLHGCVFDYSFMFSYTVGLTQPGPPGRHLGHYPSLPPGYQNTSTSHATSPMHPAMQASTQPYTQAPQPYQQVRGTPRLPADPMTLERFA